MISTKAIVALALTGMGAGVTTADIYMANTEAAPPRRERDERLKPPAPLVPKPAGPATAENAVVVLEPVTILGRFAATPARAKAKAPLRERKLVPCSTWRDVESGPSGHGVRTLCYELD